MITVLLGPPGSGKGTQAKKLSHEQHWPHLSTGDMLRTAIKNGTKLGQEAKSFMDKGMLVPDAVVIGLIAERSQAPESKNGFILDGFPRNIAQAETLDEMLANQGRKVTRAVLFEIPSEELIRRLSGRRTCLNCGAMFHIENMPPKIPGECDQCHGALVQRDDDKVDVIKKRLAVYEEQTEPLIEFYRKAGKLKTIDARRSTQEVSRALQEALR